MSETADTLQEEQNLVGFRIYLQEGERPMRIDPPAWLLTEQMPSEQVMVVHQNVRTTHRELNLFQIIRERVLTKGAPWRSLWASNGASFAHQKERTMKKEGLAHPSLEKIDKTIAAIKKINDPQFSMNVTEIRDMLREFDERQQRRWKDRIREED